MERFVASELAQGDEKEETRGAKRLKYMNICNKCGDRELVYREAVRWAEKNRELVSDSFWLR
jgi:hypothetical protein